MRVIIAAALALAVSACGTMAKDPQLPADLSCRTIGDTLRTLGLYRHKLEPAQTARIDEIARQSEPLCDVKDPPTGTDVMARLDAMRLELLAAERKVKQ